MNLKENFKKAGVYKILSVLTNKEVNTVKMYFHRNNLDVFDKSHIERYLNKYHNG